jgi:predicted transcriptional regulator
MAVARMIDQEITQYLPHLNAKQKQAVLNVVKTFAAEQQDWWDEIGEAQQQAIDKSLAEMKAGDLSSHADVMKNTKNG